MRLLGIDYGSKKIGISLSDEGGMFAFPHDVIPNDRFAAPLVAKLCREKRVGRIVMGESRDLDGRENPIMASAAAFASELEAESGVPVVFEPEFYTTAEAARIQGRDNHTDASAAALILKSYIDKRSAGEV